MMFLKIISESIAGILRDILEKKFSQQYKLHQINFLLKLPNN